MKKCRHCEFVYAGSRGGPRRCPSCGLPDKQRSRCEICGGEFFKSPSRKRVTCSTECRSEKVRRRVTTHGQSSSRLYAIWSGMKVRCDEASGVASEYYSSRGIRVCDEWMQSFEAFAAWAYASGYRPGLEIDRRKNDEGYSPDNCRWATREQQMRNTRKRRGGSSQYKGVSFIKATGRWRALAMKGGVSHHIGVFDSENDAAAAYDRWAKENFGEFASLNF